MLFGAVLRSWEWRVACWRVGKRKRKERSVVGCMGNGKNVFSSTARSSPKNAAAPLYHHHQQRRSGAIKASRHQTANSQTNSKRTKTSAKRRQGSCVVCAEGAGVFLSIWLVTTTYFVENPFFNGRHRSSSTSFDVGSFPKKVPEFLDCKELTDFVQSQQASEAFALGHAVVAQVPRRVAPSQCRN